MQAEACTPKISITFLPYTLHQHSPILVRVDHLSCDTIVIGAGAAGLAAAGALAKAGQSVVLLEARDRIGGRVHTLHPDDWPLPVELGAEYIHGKAPATLDLLRRHAVTAHDVADSHWRLKRKRLTQLDDFWERMEQLDSRLEADKRHDRTMAEFLRRTKLPTQTKSLARMYVEGFDAADVEQVGTEWIRRATRAEEKLGDGLFRVSGGHDLLIAALASQMSDRVTLHLNTIVKQIDWSPRSVLVTANQQQFESRAAIITLPLGILQARSEDPAGVRFDPPLVQKHDALHRLRMGGVVKFVLRFHEPFWEEAIDENLSFMHASADDSVPTWWSQLPVRSTVLTGWAGGPAAARLTGKSQPQLIDIALTMLSRLTRVTPRRLRTLLIDCHVHDWPADPFARGAYSYGTVGGTRSAAELARPIDQTLFFAGEATNPGMTGTVEAAIVTGYRAAEEALRARS
jgi:monoamine oxidase